MTKVFTFGPMFRYERPQKGRQRQFHQVNTEVFGSYAPQTDAEVVAMLWRYLHDLGLSHLSLHLNSLGCPACRPQFSKALQDYFDQVDDQELCTDCQRRQQTNPLRVLDCKVPGCQQIVHDAPNILDFLCPECSSHFASVQSILQACSIPFTLDHRLVRGLDYYQRTTFEVMSHDIGAQSSVAGGGRYDGLIQQLGGPPCPGIGFACGMERLAMLMPSPAHKGPDFFLAVLDSAALDLGQILALGLRENGLSGEVSYEAKSIKSQMRLAHKQQARYCILLGRSEFKDQTVMIKDMESGHQEQVAQSELTSWMARAHQDLDL